MATLNTVDASYADPAVQAALRNITVEQFLHDQMQHLSKRHAELPESPPPLTGEAWQAVWDAMRRDAEKRADRYPPGFVLDDSREAIYAERLDAQL